MNTTQNNPRYTIRPLGCTAYARTDSLSEAHRLRHEASQRNGSEVVILDETTGEEAGMTPRDIAERDAARAIWSGI